MRPHRMEVMSRRRTMDKVRRSARIALVIDLPPEQVTEMPVDQLGVLILSDLVRTNEWNEYSYLLSAQRSGYLGEAALAMTEAMGWLRARALIARTPGQTSDAAISVTRTGRRVADEGPTYFRAAERLQGGIHPLIEREARPQFLIGKYDLGVFASMKAVEVRVRQLAGFPDDVIGVALINRAFGPNGNLTDLSTAPGEQEGTRALFAGAYAVLRNPAGHREVNYDDVSEAADAVQTASLLMRILDRVETRINPQPSVNT
jgi:uncharacterized protein (TIGR02391 family)